MANFPSHIGFNVPSETDVPGFRVDPFDDVPGFRVNPFDGNPDPNIQPVKDPLKCSGPNSACSEWRKVRPIGPFRDLDNPPFRLCDDCFRKTYGRPPTGDDV